MRKFCSVLLLLALGSLGSCGGGQDHLEATVQDLQKRTAPDGAKLSGYQGLRRTGLRTEGVWELEISQDWEAYRRWVAPRLTGFEASATSPSSASFVKGLGGDTHLLQIERLPSGPALHLRLVFTARPD